MIHAARGVHHIRGGGRKPCRPEAVWEAWTLPRLIGPIPFVPSAVEGRGDTSEGVSTALDTNGGRFVSKASS